MLERETLPEAAVSDREVLQQALDWLDDGQGVALATVIATWGSSPRPVGSQCAISDAMDLVGSVSGGCVEGAVIQAAQEAIASGAPAQLEFRVADEEAWSVGLACGGRVEIRVDRLQVDDPSSDAVREAATHLADGGAGVAAISLAAGGIEYFPVDGDGLPVPAPGATAPSAEMVHAIRGAVLDDRSGVVGPEGDEVLLRVFNRPARLVIVGAVHIAQTLASLARLSGMEVVVVDPRTVFATEDRFPMVRLENTWPEEAFDRIGLDHRSAVVSLSHDPKLDDPALLGALASPAFYVGALGSRRTHEKRRTRLLEGGCPPEEVDRIASPVGLAIGARSPAEIAVAVLAEVVATLRGGAVIGAGG